MKMEKRRSFVMCVYQLMFGSRTESGFNGLHMQLVWGEGHNFLLETTRRAVIWKMSKEME